MSASVNPIHQGHTGDSSAETGQTGAKHSDPGQVGALTRNSGFPRIAIALGIATIALWFALTSQSRTGPTIAVERTLMGMSWKVEVVPQDRDQAARIALDHVFAELARIESVMSEWREDSPISQVNRAAGGPPVAVPPELRLMLERALRYSEISGGAFDVTWRGMGRLWRFDDQFVVPTAEAVERARQNVNYREIVIDGDQVGLNRAHMAIGLGGIAAGYAVDRAAGILEAAGFSNYLVDGSGDIRASGSKDGHAWRIGIQHPRAARGELLGVARLAGGALATSGDYERFKMVDGRRYHHIIDTRTGWPATASQSVTVIAPTAEQADALSTTIFILGPSDGLRLARAEMVEALVIDSEGREHATDGFRRVFDRKD